MMMGPQFMVAGLLWLLGAILTVVGVVVLIISTTAGGGNPGEDEAVEILRARFARGEIDADQFAKAKETISSGPLQGRRSRSGLIVGLAVLVAGLLLAVLAWVTSVGGGGMMGPGMMGMMGPGPTPPPETSVTMAGARFTPPDLAVEVGEPVRWFNDDAMPHTVTARDRGWDSGNISPGGSYERRFDTAGTYIYVCSYHPWMTGTIVVTGS